MLVTNTLPDEFSVNRPISEHRKCPLWSRRHQYCRYYLRYRKINLATVEGERSPRQCLILTLDIRLPRQLDAIPTVGSSSWLASWWAGLKYMTNAADVIQEGYEKASLELRTFRARLFA